MRLLRWAAINHSRRRRNQQHRRQRLEHLERLERLRQQRRREHLERPEHLEHPERPERPEHLRQKKNRRGISGYILAKRIYPESMQEGVDRTVGAGGLAVLLNRNFLKLEGSANL